MSGYVFNIDDFQAEDFDEVEYLNGILVKRLGLQ